MAFIRLSDGIVSHPKIIAAGEISPVSPWLFVAGLGYCRHHMTGGLIPIAVVPTLTTLYKRRAKDALIQVGLWELVLPNTITVHDYADWNDQEEQQREARKSKARAAANARWNGHAQALPEHVLGQSPSIGGEQVPEQCRLDVDLDLDVEVQRLNPPTTTSDLQPRPRRAVVADPHVTGGWA